MEMTEISNTPRTRSQDPEGVKARAAAALGGRSVMVVGLATTGVAACRFLARSGAVVTATDVKPRSAIAQAAELESLGVKLALGAHPALTCSGYDMVVVSPGVPHSLPLLESARGHGAEVISEIELAYRFTDCPVAAIAGTNGKTTTTTLVGEFFKAAGRKTFVGGNIGTPAVEYIASGAGADACVLEVSSFHLETTRDFNPHIGVLLNITEDHLDRYADFDEYARTKFRLFENQGPGDYAVVNAADTIIRERIEDGFFRSRVVPFTTEGTLDEGLFLRDGEIVFVLDGSEEIYPVSGIRLKGLHNIENVMAAIAVARLSNVGRETILGVLESFEGLGHRMEVVRVLDGVTYIDDSKGTNIGSLMMALRGTTGPVILIAGGRDKGGDYSVLAPLIKEKVKLMVLIGEARERINAALGTLTRTVMVDSLEDAVMISHAGGMDGDTVLLCPACSSFDMFSGYKERGERFAGLVREL